VNKRTIAALSVSVVLLLTAIIVCSFPRYNEPVYKGKRVREYLNDWNWVMRNPQAGDEAFKFFGTNAVPYVRAGLRTRDTWFRRLLLWVKPRAPWLKIRVHPAWEERFAALIVYCRILAWDNWGDASATCAPELRALMNDPSPTIREAATNVVRQFSSELKTSSQ
jgi:hypothetical protein